MQFFLYSIDDLILNSSTVVSGLGNSQIHNFLSKLLSVSWNSSLLY